MTLARAMHLYAIAPRGERLTALRRLRRILHQQLRRDVRRTLHQREREGGG